MYRTYDEFKSIVLDRDFRDTYAGKDAEETLDLVDDLRDFTRFLRQSDGSDGVRYRLAQEVAQADMNFDPAKFEYLCKASELGAGELFSRNVRQIDSELLSENGRSRVMQHLYEMADKIAEKTMSASSWEKIQEDRLEADLRAGVEEEMREQEPFIRARIYEEENIPSSTPDSALPYYVAKRMEESGVQLRTEEKVTPKFSYQLSAVPKESRMEESKTKSLGRNSVDKPVERRPLPSYGMSNSIGEKDDGWNFDEKE
jgi:hypothetical protein